MTKLSLVKTITCLMDDSWGSALTEHFLVSYNVCGCIDMNVFHRKQNCSQIIMIFNRTKLLASFICENELFNFHTAVLFKPESHL